MIPAMSGIIATAWTFLVRCLVSLTFTGSVKHVPVVNKNTHLVSIVGYFSLTNAHTHISRKGHAVVLTCQTAPYLSKAL